MTDQELFDSVLFFLREQGGPALDGDGFCTYRAANGRKCAAGCMVPEDIKPIEGRSVLSCGYLFPGMSLNLLNNLQAIHDNPWKYQGELLPYGWLDTLNASELDLNKLDEMWVPAWERAMKRLARSWGLKYTPVGGSE